MTWIYSQTTGTLFRDGQISGHGYSEHGAGKNNSSMQVIRSVGPIPEGLYTIGSPRHSTRVGAFAMPLSPDTGTQTFGRDAFFMHGDSIHNPGSASSGCVIMDRSVREQVWSSGDRKLRVIP